MITGRIVWVSDVKKVVYEPTDPFAKFEAPQADNDSTDPPENAHKNVFSIKKSLIKIHYKAIANSLVNLSWLYQFTLDGNTYKNMYG